MPVVCKKLMLKKHVFKTIKSMSTTVQSSAWNKLCKQSIGLNCNLHLLDVRDILKKLEAKWKMKCSSLKHNGCIIGPHWCLFDSLHFKNETMPVCWQEMQRLRATHYPAAFRCPFGAGQTQESLKHQNKSLPSRGFKPNTIATPAEFACLLTTVHLFKANVTNYLPQMSTFQTFMADPPIYLSMMHPPSPTKKEIK